ncbi:hypothetical protein ABGB12_05850 [Actinocorallia sp. B10E7]|uniref:hypothetical protein n=1 Tax=Actinocorallia sp. B10E7 TaxID=3153558 RepID=UPI00325E61A6
MSRRPVLIPAATAPVLLLLYGILRLVDGLDGDRGPGLAWNLGHTFFLAAFVLFGVLIVGLRRLVREAAGSRIVADPATAAGLIGVAGFLWVILCDLFERLEDAAPLPDPLYAAGPLLFQLGLLTLMVQLTAARPRLLPAWSPVLVFLGFLLIAVNLDLLPLGAVFIAGGLFPLVPRPALLPDRTGRTGASG